MEDITRRETVTGRSPDQGPIDLILGLDFGTSCSKMVIRSPWFGGGRAVAVPAPNGGTGRDYLTPSRLYVQESHALSLTTESGSREVWGLKERLRRRPEDLIARAAVTGYLARLIQHAKSWYLESQRSVLGGRSPRWSLNVGIPSAGYSDSKIKDSFRSAACAGWMVADCSDFNIEDCLAAVETVQDSELDLPVEVIPEVAAEIVGHARSDARREGLYLIVDVGAATLDIASFRLYQHDGIDEYAIFTALVKELGAEVLHKRRLDALDSLGVKLHDVLCHRKGADGSGVPDSWSEYVGNGLDKCQDTPDCAVDDKFLTACAKPVMEVLMAIRQYRDPYAPEWMNGLPVYLCGGGGQVKVYRDVLQEANDRLLKYTNTGGLSVCEIPIPEDLQNNGIDIHVYRRLAVAWGLSFDRFDIGNIVPPWDIDNIPKPEHRDYADTYVGPELT